MHHIFAAVGADGVRIILFVGVGVTIHPIDINVTLVAPLKKDIFAADRFERLMNIDDQIPQIRGMILLPQHGVELVQVDGRTLTINEIRKEFLGFAVLKGVFSNCQHDVVINRTAFILQLFFIQL